MAGGSGRAVKWQRYEAKYLVTENQAAAIRQYCLGHLPRDPHSLKQPGHRYPIQSVYLDSRNGDLLRHTLDRHSHRFKLRVRTYRHRNAGCDVPSDAPAFCEVKRKTYGVVEKVRAPVPFHMATSLLWPEAARDAGAEAGDVRDRPDLNEFQVLRTRIQARPCVGIFYMREAFEGKSLERVRVTLDRDLHYGQLNHSGAAPQSTWRPVNVRDVILEVKFTNTYPFWVADMLRRVEVQRRGVCKYVLCSQAAGAFRFVAPPLSEV